MTKHDLEIWWIKNIVSESKKTSDVKLSGYIDIWYLLSCIYHFDNGNDCNKSNNRNEVMKNNHNITIIRYFDDIDSFQFRCTALVLSTPFQLFCHCT